MKTKLIERAAAGRAYDSKRGILEVTVIKPGISKNNRYYSPELLRKSVGVFEGAKMFANHATEKERKERPEGSVNDWVAVLEACVVGEDGSILGSATVIDPLFKQKLEALGSSGLLSQMGISINAFGEAETGSIDGRTCTIIESIDGVRSVDFVTFAGAGGKVEAIESDTSETAKARDVKESLYESYRAFGLSEAEARIAAGFEQGSAMCGLSAEEIKLIEKPSTIAESGFGFRGEDLEKL